MERHMHPAAHAGMDVLAVKQATSFAKEHALTQGPIVLEVCTNLRVLSILEVRV